MGRKRKPKTAAGDQAAKETPPPLIVKDQNEAARILGVTARTLRNWMRDPGFPDHTAGYDIAALKEFQKQFDKGGSEARAESTDVTLRLKNEKLQQEKIKTHRQRLDLAEREGELLPRETQELAISKVFTNMGDRLDQLVDLIRGQCCKECRKTIPTWLKDELDSWRRDTSEQLRGLSPS